MRPANRYYYTQVSNYNMPRLSTELLHIHNKSRAWEKTDTLAQKLEKKRLARLRSVKSALKQKKVTRQSAAKLRHINNRNNSTRRSTNNQNINSNNEHGKENKNETVKNKNSDNYNSSKTNSENIVDHNSSDKKFKNKSYQNKKQQQTHVNNVQKNKTKNLENQDTMNKFGNIPRNESSSILENMTNAFNAMQTPQLSSQNNVHDILGIREETNHIEFGTSKANYIYMYGKLITFLGL